jgi:uncharacterized FlaG/YvyC family protein
MPVTDLVFTGRWPEERQRELGQVAGQPNKRDTNTPAAVKAEERPAVEVDTMTAIEPLRKAAAAHANKIEIQYRQDLEMVVMLVYHKDPVTGEQSEEVIRQIPAEEAIRLAQQLEKGKATILDEIV